MPRYDFALEGVDPHVAIEQLNRLTIMSSPRSSLAQVSREGTCNGCWERAVAFVLWTLCPTEFDFPEGGFS